ncbi:MAG TPA: dihydrolipoyl dehydrogenase [Candidatus Omnitrophota bacterium]|nr:dihydrolipoyl dehydrogenase [Candidatus Omnitrophota bacterium]
MIDIKLPEIGENIEKGTVIKLLVSVGDQVTKGQDLLELETDKATIPVPSAYSGVIKEILIKEGQDVEIGAVIMRLDARSLESGKAKPATPQPKPQAQQKTQAVRQHSLNVGETSPDLQRKSGGQPPVDLKNIKVAVVGAGPGGYAAAFLAADLGLDITLIDRDINPGGVCLYRGCIPSKALLHAAKVLSESKDAKHFGIEFNKPKIDLDKLRGWKDSVVQQLTGGLGILAKQRKVKYVRGTATFVDSTTLLIKKEDGSSEKSKFDYTVIATGSRPIKLPFQPDSKRLLDSTTALELENIPKSLLLVGAGYIGLELGTVYAELGGEVSVVEMMPGIIPGADRDLAQVLEKRLKTIFKNIMLSTKVLGMKETKDGIKVSFEDKDGKKFDETYEKVLVAIGRKPNSENLGLDKTKVKIDPKGFIEVNGQRRTADPHIYAIGDVAGNPMLAHKASHEGRIAVEAIAGHKVAFEPNAIPAVVFTDPEIAWAGLTETEAKDQGIEVEVVKYPWAASGRALTLNRSDGFTKLLIQPRTERILGVSIVGPGAGELIAEGVLALEMGSVVSDLKLSIHPHPTLTETLMESAEIFFGQSTHVYKPRKKG